MRERQRGNLVCQEEEEEEDNAAAGGFCPPLGGRQAGGAPALPARPHPHQGEPPAGRRRKIDISILE